MKLPRPKGLVPADKLFRAMDIGAAGFMIVSVAQALWYFTDHGAARLALPTLYPVCFLYGLWISFRLWILQHRLAERPLRDDAALTLLTPDEFLVAPLVPELRRLFAPLLLAVGMLACAILFDESYWDPIDVVGIMGALAVFLLYASTGIAFILLTLAGNCEAFTEQLVEAGPWRTLLRIAVWKVGGLMLSLGALAGGIILADRLEHHNWALLGLTALLAATLMLLGLTMLRKCWRRSCSAYFVFEDAHG